jgi:hypothetical protein
MRLVTNTPYVTYALRLIIIIMNKGGETQSLVTTEDRKRGRDVVSLIRAMSRWESTPNH